MLTGMGSRTKTDLERVGYTIAEEEYKVSVLKDVYDKTGYGVMDGGVLLSAEMWELFEMVMVDPVGFTPKNL